MAEIQTKIINEMAEVSPADTRKILTGDGVISLGNIKTHIISELTSTVDGIEESLSDAETDINSLKEKDTEISTTLSELETNVSTLSNLVGGMSTGGLVFNAISVQIMENGKPIDNEYGYIVLKKTSTGKLTLSALTKAEYDEIYGGSTNE